MMGASTSIMVFSCRRMAAPSLMIFRAASSSRRPSFTRWLLRTSRRGLPSSNTSFSVSRCVGGNGTAGGGGGRGGGSVCQQRCPAMRCNALHAGPGPRAEWERREHTAALDGSCSCCAQHRPRMGEGRAAPAAVPGGGLRSQPDSPGTPGAPTATGRGNREPLLHPRRVLSEGKQHTKAIPCPGKGSPEPSEATTQPTPPECHQGSPPPADPHDSCSPRRRWVAQGRNGGGDGPQVLQHQRKHRASPGLPREPPKASRGLRPAPPPARPHG